MHGVTISERALLVKFCARVRATQMCAQMLVGLCTALQQRPPVFRVTDAVSSAPVTLIGVMHYNPSSVALVWRIDG